MSDDAHWHDVCELAELASPGAHEFSHDGWSAWGFVVRSEAGISGFVNVCPHAGHPLNYRPHGFLTKDEGHIMCSSHGAMFDLASGDCVAGPCRGRALRRLEVRVQDGGAVQVHLPPDVD